MEPELPMRLASSAFNSFADNKTGQPAGKSKKLKFAVFVRSASWGHGRNK